MNAHTTPNPGSDEARAQGCTCPVLDNHRGLGSGPFWITDGCPLHAPAASSRFVNTRLSGALPAGDETV